MTAIDDAAASVQDFLARHGRHRAGLTGRALATPASGRSVFEYALADDPAGVAAASMIAKCFPDASGAQVFATLRALSAAIAAQGCRTLAVPEALHYDAARCCLVQARADGMPLGAALAAAVDADSRDALLQRAGRALGELHGLDPVALGAGTPKQLADHINDLMRPHPLSVALALPEHAARLRALTARLLEAGAALGSVPPAVPLHRDFHVSQMFVDGERIALIDWDLFAAGDPSLDVGNFMMHLELRCGAEFESAQTAFLSGYVAVRPADALARVPLYQAFNHLRRACKSFRLQAEGWPQRLDEHLERAIHWLDAAEQAGREAR